MSDLFDFPKLEDCRPAVQAEAALLRSRANIGRALLGARLDQGLSQANVAARAGTTQCRISMTEALDGNPRLDTLDRIALALGLEITLIERPAARPSPEEPQP